MPDLTRDYNVIDCETTGLGEGPEVPELIEIASCILTLASNRTMVIGPPYSETFRPMGGIEPGARATHHITAAMLADRFPVTSDDRHRFIHRPDLLAKPPAVIVAHNAEYEQKFFAKEIGEIPVLCTLKAALRVFPEAPSHSNGVLYYWLQDQGLMPDLGKSAHPMHRAGPDTLITAHILSALLQKTTTQEMLAWSLEPRLLPTCPIGDWRGKPWAEVEFGFLKWMAGKDGMEEDFRWNARREIQRRSGQGKLL